MKPPLTGPKLHKYVKNRIDATLGSRTYSWLAQASGVPQSTLSNQLNRPKFSLEVLVRVAVALQRPVRDFLPDSGTTDSQSHSHQADRLIAELEHVIAQARRRVGPGLLGEQERDAG